MQTTRCPISTFVKEQFKKQEDGSQIPLNTLFQSIFQQLEALLNNKYDILKADFFK